MDSIHILGTGAIGCHIGAILRANQHKVTLLLRSQTSLDEFQSKKNTIVYRVQDQIKSISGFEANVVNNSSEPIKSLIVATKAHYTSKALEPIISQLSEDSTILLLQNGMGVAEELVDKYWRQPSKTPTIFVGVNRHAVERLCPFDICHHSGYNDPDALRIGLFKGSTPKLLIQQISAIPELNADELAWKDLRVKMLKKLIVNASINPLATALMTKTEGSIHEGNPSGICIVRSVIEEAHQVFKDELPGETVDSLLDMVLAIGHEAGENVCSTLQDIRAKRMTEIDYINGYICRKGLEKNVNVKTNQLFVQLMHTKESLYDFCC